MLRLNVQHPLFGNRGITSTWAPSGENHRGNQLVGDPNRRETYSMDELRAIHAQLTQWGMRSTLVDLGSHLPPQYGRHEAGVLILHRAVQDILHVSDEDLFRELTGIHYDAHALMYGRVVNKHLRHNAIIADFDQAPNYQEGMGTVVNFTHTPLMQHIRTHLPTYLGPKAATLISELNDYFDVSQCGIGYHGDTERTMVIGMRVGARFPLSYCWYHRGERVSQQIDLTLESGDIYVMSEKAVGMDWKKKVIPTLRHAVENPRMTAERKRAEAKKRQQRAAATTTAQ